MDLLEQESSNLADRLIQGQVTRAEVEENTFAIKRELAAIRQHDLVSFVLPHIVFFITGRCIEVTNTFSPVL